jgi:hypothetical protein
LIRIADCKIFSAVATFDTPIDRITRIESETVHFISQTTGDTDFIDILLESAKTQAAVTFVSKAGECSVDLRELTDDSPRKTFDFGGLDMSVTIERYPENPTETAISMQRTVQPAVDKTTPYFVKVTQVDGQMAWASPIYLKRER